MVVLGQISARKIYRFNQFRSLVKSVVPKQLKQNIEQLHPAFQPYFGLELGYLSALCNFRFNFCDNEYTINQERSLLSLCD